MPGQSSAARRNTVVCSPGEEQQAIPSLLFSGSSRSIGESSDQISALAPGAICGCSDEGFPAYLVFSHES